MMERNDVIKKSKIKFVAGLACILFGILALINVGYISQTIVIMFCFVFGFIGYWVFFPLIIIFGFFLILKRNKESKIKTLYLIFLGLLIFAVLNLSTVFIYYNPSSSVSLNVTNFNQLFYSNWLNSCPASKINGYMHVSAFATSLGGGWFGYLFVALLNSSITPIGTIIAMVIITVIALIILLTKPVLELFKKIKANKDQKNEDTKLKNDSLRLLEEQEKEGGFEFNQSMNPVSEPTNNNELPINNDEVTILKHADLYGDNSAPSMENINIEEPVNNGIHVAKLDEIIEENEQNVDENKDIELSAPSFEEPKKIIKPLKPYKLPPLDLLMVYENSDVNKKNEENCTEVETVLNKTFQDFRIGAQVVGHTIGPRVTRYDIQMDVSYSVQSLPKYMQDIKQRLGGVAARFESVVVGKTTSGLEVPNKASATIGFKEMIENFPDGDKNRLLIPFGKNISGEIKYADLASFPHLLVAGSTGSGKSVFVHSVILTLIMRNTPEELKLLLVDPKHVEFTKYKNLPHLLCPTVTDPSKAQTVLRKLTEEMEHRYTLFESTTTSKITEYNELMRERKTPIMPYIVVVVDEFADLMNNNKKIDQSIATITAKARAAGIHLIIATQRPSVDVITGTIKNNLPVRVALSVSDQESSKTILGCMGAESLLGNGDMLVSCQQIQSSGNVRVQGCYVTGKEIANVVEFINEQREPQYDVRFLSLDDYDEKEVQSDESQPKLSPAEARAKSDEEFFMLVKEQTFNKDYTSISSIMRENDVGFNKASRTFKRLQELNLVAVESEASKGNKVLKENFGISKSESNAGSDELITTKPFC